jgi:polynucleotide 5'-triphosphatase
MSVSPKTQPPSLPRADSAASQGQYIDNGRSATPKRKMDDREVSAPAITPQIPNGVLPKQPTITPSPQQPARKRVRYTEPPIWAQSFTKRVKNNGGPQSKNRPVNGILVDRAGQPQQVNGNPQASTLSSRPIHQNTQDDLRGNGPLGAWEPSIIGTRPYEEVSKLVADWLFLNVVSRPDAGELAGRGVEIEIEAKLGQLINKDTNERFFLPVQSECILAENGRVGFHSTMTEVSYLHATCSLKLITNLQLYRHNTRVSMTF